MWKKNILLALLAAVLICLCFAGCGKAKQEAAETEPPTPDEVDDWDSQAFVETLEHNQRCAGFNIHFRQLIHISFRIAAEKRDQLLALLRANRTTVESRVSDNLLKRHIEPLFLGVSA